MTELSPAARSVLEAAAASACLAEWGPLNDPPCHPSDEGWNGCHLCVKRDLIAAALRAAVDQVVPEEPLHGSDQRWMFERDARQERRKKFLAIADELEAQ